VRCPSTSRADKNHPAGKVLYRAGKAVCRAFPKLGNEKLKAGVKRNFEIFEPLDFIAEVTQHIPNKGEHQIRYYGWYSNKQRGMRNKEAEKGELSQNLQIKKKCSLTWALLIKRVYEVDPFECPKCGGPMRIVSLIDKRQSMVIEKILRHCNLWKEAPPPRPPPEEAPDPDDFKEPEPDYRFFERNCI
jgi:hypothetical protein